jgi:hypothetical protein
MDNLMEFLPFIIPLAVLQFALLGAALWHALKHTTYKRGTRTMWLIIILVGMQFWGPVLYFLLGKEEA